MPSAIPASFPAASSSVWRWRARSSTGRRYCCSTSLSPTSTPSSGNAPASGLDSLQRRSPAYTTVYVTHDQSEALATADVICVMNLGKIEQTASPQEIYDPAGVDLVARFIGMSNVFKGKTLDGSTVSLAGVPLRVSGETLKGGADTPVSIRQHQIELLARTRRTRPTSFRPRWCGKSFSDRAGTIWLTSRTARSSGW